MKLPNKKTLKYSTMFGWKSRLQQRKGTFYISIDKKIARGFMLQPGAIMFSYFGEDNSERPLIIMFLDGKE